MNDQSPMDRRQFLRSAGRGAVAAGLLGGLSLLVLRRANPDDCALAIRCGECDVFATCGLPRAAASRPPLPPRSS